MIDVLILCRILLAGVFGVAGLAKATNRQGTRRAFVDLGGPASGAAVVGTLLPAIELGTAIALLFRATAWLAAGLALLLLTLFTLVLLAQFRKEVRPACPCFGFSRPKPVGRATVLRNLVLAGLAGAIVVAGREAAGADIGAWILAASRTKLLGAITLLATIGAVALVVGRRTPASPGNREGSSSGAESRAEAAGSATGRPAVELPRPDDGLPAGSPTPFWTRSTTSADEASARLQLLLFVSERFPPGRALLDEAREWERELGATVESVHVADPELARRFRVRWTPAALLLDERGRVSTPVQHGAGAVRELVGALQEASHGGRFDRERFLQLQRPTLPGGELSIGAAAPPVRLPDARGALRALHDLLEHETALIFWHPDCPHCRGMASELRRYEAERAESSARLVFVTAGPARAARRAQAEFASVSFFDEDLQIAPLFGSRGTPSAVLLDGRGRIGSALAVGRDNVLALLGISPGAAPSEP